MQHAQKRGLNLRNISISPVLAWCSLQHGDLDSRVDIRNPFWSTSRPSRHPYRLSVFLADNHLFHLSRVWSIPIHFATSGQSTVDGLPIDAVSVSPPWPSGLLPTLASIISTLPTSSLRVLLVNVRHPGIPWWYFMDLISSVILRRGSSFKAYNSSIPSSMAAVNHLIQLPNLHSWLIHGPPPDYPASSLPLVFPPPTELHLAEGAACGWLRLLERLEDNTSSM